jgi:hypothetical protein
MSLVRLLNNAGITSSAKLGIVLSKTFKLSKRLKFEDFLNLLLQVSEARDPSGYKTNQRATLMNILRSHLIPAAEEITEKIYTIDNLSMEVLNDIQPFLIDLQSSYSSKEDLKSVLDLLRELELCP